MKATYKEHIYIIQRHTQFKVLHNKQLFEIGKYEAEQKHQYFIVLYGPGLGE